jgi:putative SOS response-associated peptidase YedK
LEIVVGENWTCGEKGSKKKSGFLTSPGKPFISHIRDRMKLLLFFEVASSWNCWLLLEREAQMTLD